MKIGIELTTMLSSVNNIDLKFPTVSLFSLFFLILILIP